MKISQLEAVTKADVLEKNELLDKLSQERGTFRFQIQISIYYCIASLLFGSLFIKSVLSPSS